jgi:hypothetical protein
MKAMSLGAVLIGGVILGSIGVGLAGGQAPENADAGGSARVPRFQASASAGPKYTGFGHGYYVLDTVTGELWHARQGGPAEKVVSDWP